MENHPQASAAVVQGAGNVTFNNSSLIVKAVVAAAAENCQRNIPSANEEIKKSRNAAAEAIGMTFRDGARPKFKNCNFEVNACNKVSEENGEYSLFNGIWMHVKSARILSVFCKEETALLRKGARLENEYKRILPLPEELLVRTRCTIEAGFDCVEPCDLNIDGSPTNKLEINSPSLRKNSYILYFKSTPHPDKLDHTGLYDVSYYARLFDGQCQLIGEGIHASLDLCWPLRLQHKMPTGEREQASTSGNQNITIEKLFVGRDAYVGGQDQHIDHHQEGREDTDPASGAAAVKQVEKSSLDEMEFLEHANITMEQSCHGSASLKQEIGPEGGCIELDGCGVNHGPGAIKEKREIEISVGVNPCPSPSSATQISRMLKRKPSKTDTPVRVKLTCWVVPKPGKQLCVTIKSKTGEADWETVPEIIQSDRNIIKYDVPHFCWHVAVVSEEDEKNVEYHLFNDVWMHIETGRILSVFWKDEIALENASKALKADYKRILPIPEETIVSVGDTIIVDIQCNSPPGMRMINVDGSNARIEVTHDRMKKNFITLLFRPNPHPEKIQPAETYEVLYSANVLDANGQPGDGGFAAPLDYEWPPKAIEGCSLMNVDGSIARIEFTHDSIKKDFITLPLHSNPHPEKIQPAEPYKLSYNANVLETKGQPVDGGFPAPLDLDYEEWPPKAIEEPKNYVIIEGLTAQSAHIGGRANYYDRRRNRKGKAEFPANMKPVDATSINVKYTFKDAKFPEIPHALVDESTNDTNPGEDQSDQQ